MADRIHYVMDQQSQLLNSLQDAKIFTITEVKDLIKKRTSYEYTTKRRQLDVSEIIKYLQFEINVDKLMNIRLSKILLQENNKNNKINEYRMIRSSSVHHICAIFDRGIRRFPQSEALWNYYIVFLKHKKSNNALGKLFSKALLLFPLVENFWSQAIAFEFEIANNIHAARILLQRSLRFNSKSESLWSYYFDIECFHNLKLIQRQSILNIDVDYSVLDAIPIIIFKHAIKSISKIEFAGKLFQSSLTILGCGYTSNILETLMFDHFGDKNETLIKTLLTIKLNVNLISLNQHKENNENTNLNIIKCTTEALRSSIDIYSRVLANTKSNVNNCEENYDNQNTTVIKSSDAEGTVLICLEIVHMSLETISNFLENSLIINYKRKVDDCINADNKLIDALTDIDYIEFSNSKLKSLKLLFINYFTMFSHLRDTLMVNITKTVQNNVKINSFVVLCELYVWHISYSLGIHHNCVSSIMSEKNNKMTPNYLQSLSYFGKRIVTLTNVNNDVQCLNTTQIGLNEEIIFKNLLHFYFKLCIRYSHYDILLGSNNVNTNKIAISHIQNKFSLFLQQIHARFDERIFHTQAASVKDINILEWSFQILSTENTSSNQCSSFSKIVKIFRNLISTATVSSNSNSNHGDVLDYYIKYFTLYIKFLNIYNLLPIVTSVAIKKSLDHVNNYEHMCHDLNRSTDDDSSDDDDDEKDYNVTTVIKTAYRTEAGNIRKRKLNTTSHVVGKGTKIQPNNSLLTLVDWFLNLVSKYILQVQTQSVSSGIMTTIHTFDQLVTYILKLILCRIQLGQLQSQLTVIDKTNIINMCRKLTVTCATIKSKLSFPSQNQGYMINQHDILLKQITQLFTC